MVPLSVLSCLIQQCVYILRFACRSECGNSNPVLQAETLVLYFLEDDSTPLINRTFRGHQDWPLICHVVYYPLKENEHSQRKNRRRSLSFILAASHNYSLGLSKPGKLKLRSKLFVSDLQLTLGK